MKEAKARIKIVEKITIRLLQLSVQRAIFERIEAE
jgi:hypothetical protein